MVRTLAAVPMTNTIVPPNEALYLLREGNRRFVSGERVASPSWHPSLANEQKPFAVVLGCADSRAPAEYVFDQGLGALFVVRVAGNIVAPSLVGSIEFAVDKFGTALVVVMGHSGCGAINATVDAFEHGLEPDSKNVQSIVNRIAPNIKHLFDKPDPTVSVRDAAVRANAIASATEIRRVSPLLHDLADKGSITIIPSIFDMTTGLVTFLESS